MMKVHDHHNCLLGEGPLWHPERGELFWFDILGRCLHAPGRQWHFAGLTSAAGWIDRDRLLVATEGALVVLDLESGALELVSELEPDQPGNRPNDGRADPQGGFWIGTMDKNGNAPTGAIWRWYRGALRRLFAPITIPNAISFAPDGTTGYFADTPTQKIMRVALDATGWPVGDPQVHVDLTGTDHWPDGAVVDAGGVLWNAQWGSARIAAYDAGGREVAVVPVPASQATCPAFGGPDLTTLYCTSAAAGLEQAHLKDHPHSGRTFALEGQQPGQREHRVIL